MELPLSPWGLETERHYIPAISPSEVPETVLPPLQGGSVGPTQLPYIELPSLAGLGEVLALLVSALLTLALAALYLKLLIPPEQAKTVYAHARGYAVSPDAKGKGLYRYWGDRARVRRALDSAFRTCNLPPTSTPRAVGALRRVEGWTAAEKVLYAKSWSSDDVKHALEFAGKLSSSCKGSGRG